jgi:hypothetical protein
MYAPWNVRTVRGFVNLLASCLYINSIQEVSLPVPESCDYTYTLTPGTPRKERRWIVWSAILRSRTVLRYGSALKGLILQWRNDPGDSHGFCSSWAC